MAASGDYIDMVADNRPGAMAYCERHGFVYHEITGWETEIRTWWDKIEIFRALMVKGGPDFIVYLDADAFVVNHDVDLTTALAEYASLGLSMYPNTSPHGNKGHFNVGVMFLRNTVQCRAFFDLVASMREGYDCRGWHEQAVINNVLLHDRKWQQILCTLGTEWNDFALNGSMPSEKAIIAAFHGHSDRRATMNRYRAERGL